MSDSQGPASNSQAINPDDLAIPEEPLPISVLRPETLARMAAEKPDLVYLTLPEVGHAPMLDEPESEKAIDDFLARIDARADG